MTPITCEDVRGDAAELALDVLAGDRRAALLQHLEHCGGCRALVDDLSRTADALLLTVSTAAVSDSLSTRLHAAVDARPPRSWFRPLLAAAVVMIVATAVAVGLFAQRAESPNVDSAARFALLSSDGTEVGEVSISAEDRPWIHMDYSHGDTTATFTCIVDLDDGTSATIGLLRVASGTGSWGADLTIPPDDVRTARIVDPDGQTVATAVLD